jgi:hypothetical protein
VAFAPPFQRPFSATFDRRGASGNGLLVNLSGYWPGNEASGNLLDLHSGGRTFTDINTVTSAAGLVYATARQHTAASNERFDRNGDTTLHGSASDWSLATWIYFDAVAAQQTIWQDTGNAGIQSQVMYATYKANRLTHIMYNSVGGNAQAHADNYGAVPATTWLAVVISYTSASGQVAISVNAGTPNTATLAGTPRISASSLVATLGYSGGRPFGGRMGPTAHWRRVLTAADRTAWYNGGAGLAYAAFTT